MLLNTVEEAPWQRETAVAEHADSAYTILLIYVHILNGKKLTLLILTGFLAEKYLIIFSTA